MQLKKQQVRFGIMLSQVAPNSRNVEGETLRVLEQILEQQFFNDVQTVEIPFPEERKAFARTLRNTGVKHTYCLARVLNENHLNLSAMDPELYRRSVDQVVACLHHAVEAGAEAVSLISGPRPENPANRREALKRLEQALGEISLAAANEYPHLKIAIEPLDVEAHKKQTLGSTVEAITICESLERDGTNIRLILDSAHLLLNGEDPAEAVQAASRFGNEFHFCNCVLDREHPLFGDYHLPFGSPGILDENDLHRLVLDLTEIGFFSRNGESGLVMAEVLNREGRDPFKMIVEQKELFQRLFS